MELWVPLFVLLTMKLRATALAFFSLSGFLPASVSADGHRTVAITDVAVVSMTDSRVREHQTVIIHDRVIAATGAERRVRVPRDARVISGTGRWLVPGLVDMHTHVDHLEDLALMVAHGVTTTLNMGGASEAYTTVLAPQLRTGRTIGPYPLLALKIDGPGDEGGTSVVPRTEAEAREFVRTARQHGYDYIKVYSRLQPAIFEAIMDEARRAGIPVVGHVVRSVGIEHSLARGQVMIAHGEEYLTVFGDGPPAESRIPELVRLSVRYHVTVTANVAGITLIAEQWGHPDAVERYLRRDEALEMRPELRVRWKHAAYQRFGGTYDAEARFVQHLVAALHAARVPIIVGTDTPDIPGVPPGASAVDEIMMLHQIGFTNYEALAAGTREAGRFVARTLPAQPRFGEVRRGYRADLLLLTGNPLEDLTAIRRPLAVIANGNVVGLTASAAKH